MNIQQNDFLRALLTSLVIFTICSLVLYYQKSKRERDKETNKELFLRSIFPAFLLSILVFFMFFSDKLYNFNVFGKRAKVYLEEDYFD